MEEYKKVEKKPQLEYLNTLRWLAVVFILFTHFNFQCFSNYSEHDILTAFVYSPNNWTYILTSCFTGKLALSMMCIISGFLVARKFDNKKVEFGNFIYTRYLRLMLPIFFVGTIYGIIKLLSGEPIPFLNYLKGVLLPGNISIDDHLYCIGDFLIGNIIVGLIAQIFSNKKHFKLIYIPLIILLFFIDKIWIMATLFGGISYYICNYFKNKNILKYWHLILVIPFVLIFSCGEESNLTYLRYCISNTVFLVYIYCLPMLQKTLNWNHIKRIKKYSYSMFISHGMLYALLGHSIISFVKQVGFANDYIVEIISFIIIFMIDILISAIIYEIAEVKIYKFVNSFSKKEEVEKKNNQNLLKVGAELERR